MSTSKEFITELKDRIENIFESIFVRRDLERQDFVEGRIGEGKVIFTRDKEDKNLVWMRIYDGYWEIEHESPIVVAPVTLSRIQTAKELLDVIKGDLEYSIAHFIMMVEDLEN